MYNLHMQDFVIRAFPSLAWLVYLTCQWEKHRWDSWHHWICRCRQGTSGRSYDSWFCCMSPRGSLRRKVCPLKKRAKIMCNHSVHEYKLQERSKVKNVWHPNLKRRAAGDISTHPRAFRTGTPPLTTSRTLCRNSRLHLGISVPQVKCSLGFPQPCHIVPYHPKWAQAPNNFERLYITVKAGTTGSLAMRTFGKIVF